MVEKECKEEDEMEEEEEVEKDLIMEVEVEDYHLENLGEYLQ